MPVLGPRIEDFKVLTADDITVEIRLANEKSKVKAFADVTLTLKDCGTLTLYGFSVIEDPPRVLPPARQKDQRFYEVLALTGKLKSLVYTLIGMAYKAALEKATKEVA
jgi:hypothetical protein